MSEPLILPEAAGGNVAQIQVSGAKTRITFNSLGVPTDWLRRSPRTLPSSNAFVVYHDTLETLLAERYGRSGLCLKVFKGAMNEQNRQDHETYHWGSHSLVEAVRIQNLFAFAGYAPRIYDVVLVNGEQVAQVTDFVEPIGVPRPEKVRALIKKYNIESRHKNYDLAERNWRGRYLVDFGSWAFANPKAYEASLRKRARTRIASANRGTIGERGYQELSFFGVPGDRNLEHRARVMRLDEIDFAGKTVFDIGCNMGQFCHEADKRGARKVVGADREYIASIAREIANWVGRWNIDIFSLNLPEEIDEVDETFDVVFAFSMFNPLGGYASWIPALTHDILLVEGHGGDPRSRFEPQLNRDFGQVEFLGYTIDTKKRPVWRCHK